MSGYEVFKGIFALLLVAGIVHEALDKKLSWPRRIFRFLQLAALLAVVIWAL